MEITHFSHKHPLIFNEATKDDHNGEIRCYGCQQPISSSPSYNCSQCKFFFLHKICFDLPQEMNLLMHLQHPLTLVPKPPYPRRHCCACRRPCEGFTYQCLPCNFEVCASCASLGQKVEHVAHEHPLNPLLKPATFLCDACGSKHEGASFHCTSCQFWISQKCALLPSTVEINYHSCSLSLTYSFPQDGYRGQTYCDVCGKEVNKVNWFYCCAECGYYAHVNCATLKTKLTWDHKAMKNEQNSEVIEEQSNLIRLPSIDENVGQTPHLMKKNKKVQMFHVNHPHPLCLVDMEETSEELCYGSKLLLCFSCAKPISAPFYHCDKCNFSLHKHCAQLTFELRYGGHDKHLLTLTRWLPPFSDRPLCQCCKMQCSDVLFGCLACNFFLDIDCALLQGVIVHEAHEHALVLRKTLNAQCAACQYRCSEVALACGVCKFYLHLQCAFLPRTVRHECDEHPFTLVYPNMNGHLGELYCEICEEIMNTKCWFYHCGDCDRSLQVECIHKADVQGSSLFIIKHESHIHTLSLVAVLDYKCAGCNCNSFGVAFACDICNFKLHPRCAFLPQMVRHRYDRHPYVLTYNGDQEEYICDICEGNINPDCWFYHCDDCNQSFHTICVMVDEYSGIKIGDELKVKGHEHLLTYIRQPKPKDVMSCDRCGERVKGSSFECASCKFRLHYYCALTAANERMLLLEH